MPYINKNDRTFLDGYIHQIVNQLKLKDLFSRPGDVNYTITRIVAGSMKPDFEGWSYHSLSRAIAILNDSKTEMERRLMAKREDQVIANNGDLEEYQ